MTAHSRQIPAETDARPRSPGAGELSPDQGQSDLERFASTMLPSVTRGSRPAATGLRHYRSLFISDLHLGSRGCKTGELVTFLRQHRCETLYLVGDVFDTWRPMGPNWTEAHDDVIRALLDIHRAGARVVFLPGNHDSLFHRFHGTHFGAVTVARHVIHTAADGQRYLVIHGDSCDVFADRAPWLAQIGAQLESLARLSNYGLNRLLRRAGLKDWNGLEECVNVVNAVLRRHDRFEERLAALALRHGADGIVCGHFHQPALHADLGVTYANCGDWVENQSAIAENDDGTLSLIDWAKPRAASGQIYTDAGQEEGLALAN